MHSKKQLISQRNFMNFSLLKITILIFILPQLLYSVNSQCDITPTTQSLYINQKVSCSLTFCRNNTLILCQRIQCKPSTNDCVTTMQTKDSYTCKQYCCYSIQPSKNNQSVNSQSMCNFYINSESISNNPGVGGYILIAAFILFFGVLVFGICICKKRDRERANENPNLNPSNYVVTSVNLSSYDIDAQGPYFVNSNDSCAICLDNKVNLRTHCNHFYHGNCLLAWLKKKPNNPCPLCMGISYNPIKVYCQQCHAGDKLVNIEANTAQTVIKEYDYYKCENCRKYGNESFSLSQQQNHNQIKKEQLLKGETKNKHNLTQQKDQVQLQNNFEKTGSKSKRRRKVESLKKVNWKSSEELEDKSEKMMRKGDGQNREDI